MMFSVKGLVIFLTVACLVTPITAQESWESGKGSEAYKQALKFSRAKEYRQAFKFYEQALKQGYADIDIYLNYSWFLFLDKQTLKAIQTTKKAYAKDKKNRIALSQLAVYNYSRGNSNAGESYYDEFFTLKIPLDELYDIYCEDIGRIDRGLFARLEYHTAAQTYFLRKVEESKPGFTKGIGKYAFEQASEYSKNGKSAEAYAYYELALAQENTFPEVYTEYAWTLYNEKKLKRALQVTEEGFTEFPRDSFILEHMALFNFALGEFELGKRYYNKLFALTLARETYSETYKEDFMGQKSPLYSTPDRYNAARLYFLKKANMLYPGFAFKLEPEYLYTSQEEWVIDLSESFTREQAARLNKLLSDYETRKGSRIRVMIVNSTGGISMEDFAANLARNWKKAGRGIDDGVLLLVTRNDFQIHIRIGYLLKGVLTQIKTKSVGKHYMRPLFKNDEFYEGMHYGVRQIIALIEQKSLPRPRLRISFNLIIVSIVGMIALGLAFIIFKAVKRHHKKVNPHDWT